MKQKLKILLIAWMFSSCIGIYAQRHIRETLQPYVDAGELPGMVTVIADGEKVLSLEYFGYQNITKKKKMNDNTLFWIASQSKSITAAAVMLLVDEGKLNLDEPITTCLPELNNLKVIRLKRDNWQIEEKPSQAITLRKLLSNTSGMQFLAGIQQQAGKIDVLPFSLSLYASALTPLSAEPGEMYLYSNQGFNIAATVVERVSGMSLDKFLHQRLFVPLDMKSATFYPSGKQLENLATPYKKGQNGQLAETEINQLQYPLCDTIIRFAEAGGGLFCIPSDHVKFYQMLANKGVYKGKRILSETAVDEMTRKQTGEKVSVPYGFGLNVTGEDFGHGGAYGTQTVVSRKDGRIMMYFIQQDGLPKHEEALNAFLKAAKQQ